MTRRANQPRSNTHGLTVCNRHSGRQGDTDRTIAKTAVTIVANTVASPSEARWPASRSGLAVLFAFFPASHLKQNPPRLSSIPVFFRRAALLPKPIAHEQAL